MRSQLVPCHIVESTALSRGWLHGVFKQGTATVPKVDGGVPFMEKLRNLQVQQQTL